MQKCWQVDVDNRICFKDIVAELSNITAGLSLKNSNDSYITVL